MDNNDSNKRSAYQMGRRVPKSEQVKTGYQRVEVGDIPRDEPILLALSGNGAVSERHANGMAREVYNLLGIKPKDDYISVYSISYGAKPGKNTGNMLPEEVEELATNIFLPRVMNESGERLSLVQLCKNLRQINVVSYCFGQEILNDMVDYTINFMLYNLGYHESEIEASMRQVLNVCFAPYDSSHELITNVNFKSLTDNIRKDKYVRDFTKNNSKEIVVDELDISTNGLRVDDNTVDIFANSFTGYKKQFERLFSQEDKVDEHAFNYILGRDADWRNHNSDFADIYSRCFALAISAGVVNSRQNQQTERYIPLPRAAAFRDLMESVMLESHSQDLFDENKNYQQQYADEMAKQ